MATPQTLVATWERLSRLPYGRRLFSRLLGRMVPYSGSISPLVLALAPGYARVQIRITKKLMNHIRSAHAMALGNLAELTGGLALSYGMPADRRLVASKFTLEYTKRGYGVLVAECRAPQVAWGTAAKQIIDVEIVIRDAAGDTVVRGEGTYHISQSAEVNRQSPNSAPAIDD